MPLIYSIKEENVQLKEELKQGSSEYIEQKQSSLKIAFSSVFGNNIFSLPRLEERVFTR